MSNQTINELDFEKKINDLPDRQLLEFVARQNYETCIRCENHNARLQVLEVGIKKISSIAGAITGTITAVAIGILNYFIVRN